MTGETVGEVLASADPAFVPGDIAVGARGWQTHSVSDAAALAKVERRAAPLGAWLGVLGMPGTTAYSGMKDIGQPRAGETVVVSAASGAVGSVAGQLAKRAGCRVVGVAGGADKCLWVQETLGFDDCVDHHLSGLVEALREACPNGIDVYFENVGGAVQDAVFRQLNPHARVVMSGMVAQYNMATFPPGPNLGFVVGKRVRIEGMIDRRHRRGEGAIGGAVADRGDVHHHQAGDGGGGFQGGHHRHLAAHRMPHQRAGQRLAVAQGFQHVLGHGGVAHGGRVAAGAVVAQVEREDAMRRREAAADGAEIGGLAEQPVQQGDRGAGAGFHRVQDRSRRRIPGRRRRFPGRRARSAAGSAPR